MLRLCSAVKRKPQNKLSGLLKGKLVGVTISYCGPTVIAKERRLDSKLSTSVVLLNYKLKSGVLNSLKSHGLQYNAQWPPWVNPTPTLTTLSSSAQNSTFVLTLRVGRQYVSTNGKVLSYGSCQFPTLGFVVERYKEIDRFEAETFYKIEMTHEKDNIHAEFNWRRGRIFNHAVCFVLYEKMQERPEARVQRITSKPKSKCRPQPMDTITLEKLASRKLRITAKEALKHAEALYTAGLISYPRTDTNKFPPEFQLASLVEAQTASPQWGDFAQKIMNEWGGPHPRNGNKFDQAHPPIHPTKYANINLQDNKGKVYELVVRHFLACVSEDARGQETQVEVTVDEEHFSLNGLQVLQRNYLEVYPYEKWSSKEIPVYNEQERFLPSGLFIREGQTSAPNLLTEADLIALMEKHGIGTDATHAEHIEKVKDREYIGLCDESHLVPGLIGMGLVEGYDNMGFEMSKPKLRAALERDLQRICDGTIDHQVVLRGQIEAYRRVFVNAVQQLNKLSEAFAKFLGENPLEGVHHDVPTIQDAIPCPQLCVNGRMVLRRNRARDKWFLFAACCQTMMWMPSESLLGCEVSEELCDLSCNNTTHKICFKLQPGKFTQLPRMYVACVVCDPDPRNLFNLRFVQGTSPGTHSNNGRQNGAASHNRGNRVAGSSGRARGTGRRGAPRNCGACGRSGHRRTTCPNNGGRA
ncbi:DNA topoisomerase 3-alpha-like isoform X2 [Varroa jacobsoni]|uniref:DNA topoisomerase n=1 Tax=Varroa destructor TaxID=109461 RepID=A0A7M7MI98_VARDE|nr:DNA topoisomerase 3-alpha-like isoform X2 [Varroa destructor]XP_022686631.1 DNA topoisomerase 3-alpha-like isoform X2 [Varroa jacobsoni]